jgi:tripartite-type tricarboxylate transporter receptor subunit TctC
MFRFCTLTSSKMWLLSKLCACVAVIAALSLSAAASQQGGRTIAIIVPYTPGTGPDILARVIGEELQQRWGQPVVIDNKPGASGNIGTQVAARAAPDGHTLVKVPPAFTQNVGLFKSLPYDPVTSFAPIIEVAAGFIALAVHPSVPTTSTRAFIDYVKARPGQVTYSSPGHGTPHHLCMELFKLATRIDVKHIPARGFAPAPQDLVGGHVNTMFIPIHVALPLAQGNQIRLLAVASKERVIVAPDVPTLAEQEVTGVEFDLWYGILAPAGTPRETVVRYNTVLNEILRSPPVVEKLAKQGLITVGGTPERFGEFIAKDLAKWLKIVREAGITAE